MKKIDFIEKLAKERRSDCFWLTFWSWFLLLYPFWFVRAKILRKKESQKKLKEQNYITISLVFLLLWLLFLSKFSLLLYHYVFLKPNHIIPFFIFYSILISVLSSITYFSKAKKKIERTRQKLYDLIEETNSKITEVINQPAEDITYQNFTISRDFFEESIKFFPNWQLLCVARRDGWFAGDKSGLNLLTDLLKNYKWERLLFIQQPNLEKNFSNGFVIYCPDLQKRAEKLFAYMSELEEPKKQVKKFLKKIQEEFNCFWENDLQEIVKTQGTITILAITIEINNRPHLQMIGLQEGNKIIIAYPLFTLHQIGLDLTDYMTKRNDLRNKLRSVSIY